MPIAVALILLLASCAAITPQTEPSQAYAPAAAPSASLSQIALPLGGEVYVDAVSVPRAIAPGNEAQAISEPRPSAPESLATAPGAAPSADDETGNGGDDEEATGGDTGEGESHEAASMNPALHYTGALADADLAKLWSQTPDALGSMSVGFVDAGRLLNGVQFPSGEGWLVVSPGKAWGTGETVAYVEAAIAAVRAQYPNAPRLRVNQISAKDGGYIQPHQSHQSGRDVDLAFYYPGTEAPLRARAREKVIDAKLTWALVKALATQTDVQVMLLDRRVQKRLYDVALEQGEDRSWLNSLFHGKDALIKHARGHRDHLHVRFFNPRAQELGRRITPFLAMQPEHNLAMHKVRRGDNLGALSRRYGSTPTAIRKANHMKNNALRAGITLSIPIRGACTHCPVPPAVVIPERRLPPSAALASAPASARKIAAVQ